MYKVKYKLCPAYISNIFKKPNSTYNLRQADFSIPRYETVTYGKHSIRYLEPRLWPKLPKSIRDVTTLMSFKGKIHKLNIRELLDDGCAGCSLCSSWFLYIFITNPVIRSCRYSIRYYLVFSLFSLLILISSNWCPQISKGFFPG